jgi:hypothetical protein
MVMAGATSDSEPRRFFMRRWIHTLTALLILAAVPTLALSPGNDVMVPAAGRNAPWVTDLYVMNPGTSAVNVTVYWLKRGEAHPSPSVSISFLLAAGETEVMDDVILNDFGITKGDGAFLVQTSGGDVIVNSRIYATDGSATFGQGFEGVPAWALTQEDDSTDVVGLTQGFGFRTNVYAIAGSEGASIDFGLMDPTGAEIGTAELTLGAYEPYLKRITRLFSGLGNFRDGTLHVEVTSGSAVAGASKVDEMSDDPTTLEPALAGGGGIDGTYQFAIYDSIDFASGGNIVISGGDVTFISGTYINYDKGSDPEEPDCPVIFQFDLEDSVPVEDFDPATGGVTFVEDYTPDSGVLTFTFEFTVENNQSIEGTVAAEGEDFPSDPDPEFDESGCNGAFPDLDLLGGKSD